MDCFNAHYYRLNRKLLVFMAQWPYQNRTERIIKLFMFLCIILLQVAIQGGRAISAEIDFDICIEFISEIIATLLVCIRYFGYTINIDKIKKLLDNIRLTWQSLIKTDEREVFCKCMEEGRLYILHYTIVNWLLTSCIILLIVTSPLLIYTPLTNVTCPIMMMYLNDFVIDPQKSCFLIIAYVSLVISTLILGLFAVDMMYLTFIYHAIAMFKVVCYQLEHSFDNCTKETKSWTNRTCVNERISNAVKCHKAAIRFSDDIVSAYEWTNLVSLMIALVNIAITLYWVVISRRQSIKLLFALILVMLQFFHVFILVIPAQKMIDNSEAVTFKAYSCLWYMGCAKEQTLLLLTMQRGLKPSAMVIGKMYPATLENFATEVKASFSYFTVLMTMK